MHSQDGNLFKHQPVPTDLLSARENSSNIIVSSCILKEAVFSSMGKPIRMSIFNLLLLIL